MQLQLLKRFVGWGFAQIDKTAPHRMKAATLGNGIESDANLGRGVWLNPVQIEDSQ